MFNGLVGSRTHKTPKRTIIFSQIRSMMLCIDFMALVRIPLVMSAVYVWKYTKWLWYWLLAMLLKDGSKNP